VRRDISVGVPSVFEANQACVRTVGIAVSKIQMEFNAAFDWEQLLISGKAKLTPRIGKNPTIPSISVTAKYWRRKLYSRIRSWLASSIPPAGDGGTWGRANIEFLLNSDIHSRGSSIILKSPFPSDELAVAVIRLWKAQIGDGQNSAILNDGLSPAVCKRSSGNFGGVLSCVCCLDFSRRLVDHLSHLTVKVSAADFKRILSETHRFGAGFGRPTHLTQLSVIDRGNQEVDNHSGNAYADQPTFRVSNFSLEICAAILIIGGMAFISMAWWLLVSSACRCGLNGRIGIWFLLGSIGGFFFWHGMAILISGGA
jgi:hypothetical protein